MNENKSSVPPARETLKTVVLDQWQTFWDIDRGVERDQLSIIKKYASSPHAIVISGLRRVGKSTLLAQVGSYLNQRRVYYLNFEDERLSGIDASSFGSLHDVLRELFGERSHFLFDEIQNVNGWERFVRRLTDENYKCYITGSNASLLSRELGTKLTGRHIPVELFPFSFTEFLRYRNESKPVPSRLTSKEGARLSRLVLQYVTLGGIPEALKYPELPVHRTIYDDVLYRDIAARYQITELRALKELSYYCVSNVSYLASFNKLKSMLMLGSVNTVKSYVDFLETSWLLFVVNVYAHSVKKQQIAAKKLYSIDTGLAKTIGFLTSLNIGRWLENLVFLTIRRNTKDIFYYKTSSGFEVDFYLPKRKQFIQVVYDLTHKEVARRELRALTEALDEHPDTSGIILTTTKNKDRMPDARMAVRSLGTWLLSESEQNA